MALRYRAGRPLQRSAPTIQYKFQVQLYDFACEALQTQDQPCDAYLKIQFDEGKPTKTAVEPDNASPEWGFKTAFQHPVAYLEQLCKRHLKVQCFNARGGRLIGSASVDLQTVACGPTHYQFTLRGSEDGEPQGTLKFTCVMRMVSPNLTVVCQDLTLTMLGCYASASLQIISTLEEKDDKVAHAPHSQQGVWPGPFSFVFETTLKEFLKADETFGCRFVVTDEMGVRQGEALLEYRKCFSVKAETIMDFKVPVTFTCTVEGEDAPSDMGSVGELEGIVLYQNLPVYAQMVNGVYVDGHVEGGHLLIEGLSYPQCMPEPPPVWLDPGDRTGFDCFLADQDQDAAHLNVDDLDDKQLSEALAQIDLPPPWEKRRERGGGKMYFSDPRSRRMTWKDPRFLSESWDQRIDQQTGKVYFLFHKTRQTSSIDPRGCPAGWEMRLSKSGDVYFAHMPARKSTWIDPRGLPEQIEAALDDQGRMYFKCNETKTTMWEDPRDNQQEVVLAHWRHQQSVAWWRDQIFHEIEQRADEQRAEMERADEEDSDA